MQVEKRWGPSLGEGKPESDCLITKMSEVIVLKTELFSAPIMFQMVQCSVASRGNGILDGSVRLISKLVWVKGGREAGFNVV